MRCKKHYTDLSSTVGVCASCLREHLLSLIAAQEQAQAQAQAQNLDEKHRNLEKDPVFPRSVSPYINCRKSDHSANRRKDHHPLPPPNAPRHHHSLSDQMFYRTPKVGPTTGCHSTAGHSHNKRSFMRWFSFPKIFRSRNRNSVDTVSVPGASDSTFREQCGGGNATSSPSWFSNIIHGGRYRKKQPVYVDESSVTAAGGVVRRQHCRDRGMSPVRNSDGAGGDEDELYDATSGYESTESMKKTPRRTPVHLTVRRGGGGGHGRTLSGLTFCLSPMVRASPNRQWNQKSLPADGGLSGEIRAPVKPHLSYTKSFCANRSRKLADFGRPNPNR